MASALKTENLTYRYSVGTAFEKTAINNINIDIEAGEFVGIIGHTGSGKSTLVQHFNGLLKPSSGRVFVDGEDIWKDKATVKQARFKVGLCFQYPEYQLFEETTYKDIAFGPKNMGLSEDETDKRIKEVSGFLGLTDEMLSKSPFELSGGEKRRAAIAGVMAMEPEILILDEPTCGLDPAGRDRILGMISDYRNEKHSTVLIVSHSMEDVAKTASKILVINRSAVEMYGTVDEVFNEEEKLSAMGLDVPQITKIFIGLSNAGIPVPRNVYTMEQAAEEIDKIIPEEKW